MKQGRVGESVSEKASRSRWNIIPLRMFRLDPNITMKMVVYNYSTRGCGSSGNSKQLRSTIKFLSVLYTRIHFSIIVGYYNLVP